MDDSTSGSYIEDNMIVSIKYNKGWIGIRQDDRYSKPVYSGTIFMPWGLELKTSDSEHAIKLWLTKLSKVII